MADSVLGLADMHHPSIGRLDRSTTFRVNWTPSPPKPSKLPMGVWSPFGEPFHSHGEVQLKLGRKPMRPLAAVPAQSGARASAPSAADDSKCQQQLPFPPMMRRGLGLGLGLHPQRFPRDLLRSSEQRVQSCAAGHDSANILSGSKSDPLLHSRIRFAPSFVPSPPSTPDHDDEDQPLADEDEEESSTAPPPPLSMSAVMPQLPLGVRATIEFKDVQRQTRLSLQEALEERQRLRASVYSLRHAESSLGPLILDRHQPRHFRRSPSHAHHDAAHDDHDDGYGAVPQMKLRALGTVSKLVPISQLASVGPAEPNRGPGTASFAKHHDERRSHPPSRQVALAATPSNPPPTGGGLGGGGSVAGSKVASRSALLHGRPSLWHATTESMAANDGGRLLLWQAVLEKWEQRKPNPTYDKAESQAEVDMGHAFFECVRELVEASPDEPLSAEYHVEGLFVAASPLLIDADGKMPPKHAFELLLPLLRAAADCLGPVDADEFRRLQREYAEPAKLSQPSSPGGLRRTNTVNISQTSRSGSPSPGSPGTRNESPGSSFS